MSTRVAGITLPPVDAYYFFSLILPPRARGRRRERLVTTRYLLAVASWTCARGALDQVVDA